MLTAVMPEIHLKGDENQVLIPRNPTTDLAVIGCNPHAVCNPS